MNLFFKKIKQARGVSLIELLVAISLFSFMILAATQIFKMVIDGQRNAVSAQNVQENIRYTMEKISKEIRMARIANHGASQSERDCKGLFSGSDPSINKVFNLTTTYTYNDTLYFKNKDNVCVAYFLESNRLKIKIIKASGGNAFEDFITPAKIAVSNLKFQVVDDLIDAFHSTQPYVTMAMDAKAVGLAIHKQEMKIQMTVSSRYYE